MRTLQTNPGKSDTVVVALISVAHERVKNVAFIERAHIFCDWLAESERERHSLLREITALTSSADKKKVCAPLSMRSL